MFNLLIDAAWAIDLAQVRTLLNQSYIPEYYKTEQTWSCNSSYSALHCAVFHGNREMVRLLLGHNFRRNLVNTDNQTPLVMALAKAIAITRWDCIEEFANFPTSIDDLNEQASNQAVAFELIGLNQYVLARQLLQRVTATILENNAQRIVQAAIARDNFDAIHLARYFESIS